MNGPLFFAVMMAVVLAFGIAMFWQESQRMQQSVKIYGVEDSVVYIWERLRDDAGGLSESDVRRILEWEMHFLQQPDLWTGEGPPVVGGEDAATYTQESAFEAGYSYEPGQIYAVFDLQAEYLVAIGALGAAVDPGDAAPQ